MIYTNYLAKTSRDHLGFLLAAALLVGGLQVLIMTVVVEMQFLDVFKIIIEKLPPAVQAALGEQFLTQLTLAGAAALGYNHPIVLTFLGVLAITIPAQHLAGENEDGTLHLVLALPVRRWRVLFSLWCITHLFLVLVVAAGWGGTAIARQLFPAEAHIPLPKIFQLGVNLWLVMGVVGSYTCVIAVFAKEGTRVALRSAALTLLFFFWNYTTQIWKAAKSLEIFSIFHYYQPRQIIQSDPGYAVNILILIVLNAVLISAALYGFERKDISG